jgi:hypothetical protein
MAQSSVGTKQRSRVWMVVVGVILVLAIAAGAAYYAFSGFFNANGTWYGPMKVKTGVATISIETYMDVSTNVIGGMSGTGTFCVPLPFNNSTSFDYSLAGNHAFDLPGRDDPQAVTLTAEYTVPVAFGFSLPLGPTLTMHGNVASSILHLTGGDSNAATTLDMKHGSKNDFTKACKSLAPLG